MVQQLSNQAFYNDVLPDITRPDVGIITISEWRVDSPERQKAAVDANMDAWRHAPWPEGLISHSCYAGTDGHTIMHYAQWSYEEAYDTFLKTGRSDRVQNIDAVVPGIERIGIKKYQHYRSIIPDGEPRVPGCIVIVSFETDGPATQRRFVDTLIDTVSSRITPHPGMIASHFHHSIDGTQVINYAEFTNEQAHEETLRTSLRNDGEVLQLISQMAGLRPLGFKRYHFYRSTGK